MKNVDIKEMVLSTCSDAVGLDVNALARSLASAGVRMASWSLISSARFVTCLSDESPVSAYHAIVSWLPKCGFPWPGLWRIDVLCPIGAVKFDVNVADYVKAGTVSLKRTVTASGVTIAAGKEYHWVTILPSDR